MAQYRIIKMSKTGSVWYQIETKSYFLWHTMPKYTYIETLAEAELRVKQEQEYDNFVYTPPKKEVIREYC